MIGYQFVLFINGQFKALKRVRDITVKLQTMNEAKMILKTKGMRDILDPINNQINKLKQLLVNKSTKSSDTSVGKSNLLEQMQNITEKLDNLSKDECCDYQEMKTKITNTVEEFCSLSDMNKLMGNLEENLIEDIMNNLLDKFISVLKVLEDLECLPLKQRLQDCYDYVKEMGAVSEIEDFQNVKELGTSILEVFVPLQRYRKSLISELLSRSVALYSCQLYTTFSMLVQLIQDQHQLNAPIYSCKKYICDRMCLCLKLFIDTLDAPNPSMKDETFEAENHFVYRMDLALDILLGMSGKTQEEQMNDCTDLWKGIEDVFSHAMSIAQVCQPYNFKAISGTCQSIMSEYENLKLQLFSEAPDPSLNNLFMNTLTDALYRLERKVNVSILTLVMEVFSDPFTALRKLVMSCGNSLNAKQRSENDLIHAIEDFDQVTDKTMQIGMFAIACCRDINRVSKIRNAIASLESLETELVSAITAFYLHPDNKEMRACVKLLTAQWQSEMNTLHDTVDRIIDSAAYCQVILDDLQDRIKIMSDCLDNREAVTQNHVQGVVHRALSLASQLTATASDIGHENIDRQTVMMIRELKAAIYEADAASKNLLVENATEPQQLRVIKRCELILNVVKRLQPAMVIVMNNSVLINTSYSKSSIGQGDSFHDSPLSFPSSVHGLPRDEKTFTYIRTPYTVKNYKPPLSIQPANSIPRTESDLSCLIPYIRKGRMMRIERSIMYKTPRRNQDQYECSTENELKMRNLSTVRQHLFSRDSFSSQSDIDLTAESMDLTAILEKITSLSGTLTSVMGNSHKIETRNDVSTGGLSVKKMSSTFNETPKNMAVSLGLCLSNLNKSISPNKLNEYSTDGGGDAPSAIETPERLNDLHRLNRKIDTLQKHISN